MLIIIGSLFGFLAFFIIAIEYLPLETLFSFFQRSCFFDFLFCECFFLYITPLIFVISCPPYTSIRIIGDFLGHISFFVIGDQKIFHSFFYFSFAIISTSLIQSLVSNHTDTTYRSIERFLIIFFSNALCKSRTTHQPSNREK